MKEYSWPNPLEEAPWDVKAPKLPRELVHAVGAVVIAWTHCENMQLGILRELSGFGFGGPSDFRVGSSIFEPMGNRQRSELLAGLIEETNPPEPLKSLLEAFHAQFNTCLTNRNLVAHALFIDEDEGTLIQSSKSHPKIQHRYIPSDAAFWELTIVEIRRLADFGLGILDSPFYRPRLSPWPDIPPKPRNLASILPIHIVERAQLQSSGE